MYEVASVSVVIPCFRCIATIERAVESVHRQTVKPYEVLLVDDYSDDGTLSFLQSLKMKYNNGWLKVIALDSNVGPGVARNAGWDRASQKYVAFLDADDSWHPQKIEIQYGWMEVNPDVYITGHRYIKYADTGNADSVCSLRNVPSRRISKNEILMKNQFATPTVILRRCVASRFLEGKKYAEDYLLWLEIVCSGLAAQKLEVELAFIHKAPYGEKGLSANLWKMQKGEIAAYRQLGNMKSVSKLVCFLLINWSWLRFFRRLLLFRFNRV